MTTLTLNYQTAARRDVKVKHLLNAGYAAHEQEEVAGPYR